jgi:hypothetical protein
MDANSLQLILATTEAYWLLNRQDAARSSKAVFVALEPIKQQCLMMDALTVHQPFSMQRAVCMAAAGEELTGAAGKAAGDVWKDQTVLDLLSRGKPAQHVEASELERAQKRARSYYLVGEQLLRRMPDGTEKVVPPPSSRLLLMQQQHHKCGHHGARRTAAMLLTKYWWYGLLADVSALVHDCEHCSLIQEYFTAAAGEELIGTAGKASGDVWKDQTVLDLLSRGQPALQVDASELKRAQKRARSY